MMPSACPLCRCTDDDKRWLAEVLDAFQKGTGPNGTIQINKRNAGPPWVFVVRKERYGKRR